MIIKFQTRKSKFEIILKLIIVINESLEAKNKIEIK